MNRMIPIAVFLLAAALPASADVLEVKGRGVINGKTLSRDAEGITFEDADGRTARYAASDILFFEKEAPASTVTEVAKKKSFNFSAILADAKRFFANSPAWLHEIHSATDKWTKKFRDVAGKPLDRSAADKKGEELAKALDDAGKAQAEMAAKTKRANEEIRRQKTGDSGSSSSGSDSFKGTFGKL